MNWSQPLNRRKFVGLASGAAASLFAGGCDVSTFDWPGTISKFDSPETRSIDLGTHVLNRLSYGPRPGDFGQFAGRDTERAVSNYIERQLAPASIDDAKGERHFRRFNVLLEPAAELYEFKEEFLLDQLTRSTILRAVYSERQLFELMVEFWRDHFNIDISKGECCWLKVADEREVIRRHALGNFRAMLGASALSPAMLWYLDGRVNRKQSPEDKPNENYARELMELHTLGVNGGYTQQDVMEVARCLSGWTVRSGSNFGFYKAKVEFDAAGHDTGTKRLLGKEIVNSGADELATVLDIVASHPSTAHHLASKLCCTFISDEPSAESIQSVAETFLSSKTEIVPTLRTLFNLTEFRETRGNKLKRPFRFIVSALRATRAKTDGKLLEPLRQMGHAPFQFPTPDGYSDLNKAWTDSLFWRWRFALDLAESRIGGSSIDSHLLQADARTKESFLSLFFGRIPTSEELEIFTDTPSSMALALCSPAFQMC